MIHVECRTCGATLTMDDHHRSAVCPYCASPTVVERPRSADTLPPSFALGFGITRERATELVRAWAKEGWFRKSGLAGASIEDLRGIYVPAWLFGAVVEATYAASIGESYEETHTRTVTNAQGQTTTETYTTTETEWRDLSGRYVGYVSDVLVTASRVLDNAELNAIEPFDLRALARYSPSIISGWLAEDVTLAAQASRAHAHEEAVAMVTKSLEDFMPGDSQRGLRHDARFSSESADVVLVPVWVLAMRIDPNSPPIRVLVNGQNGKVVGKKPLSWWKIFFAVITVLVVLPALLFLFVLILEAVR